MKRILRIVASADPRGGGPIEGITRLSALRPDIEVTVVTLDRPDAPWLATSPLTIVPLGLRALFWMRLACVLPWMRYGYSPHLVPWLRAHLEDFDLVIVHGLWNYAALGARRVLPGSGTPYVVFTHGMLDPWFKAKYPLKHGLKQLFWWACEGPLLTHARAVLFTSEDEKIRSDGAFRPYRLDPKVVGYGTADVAGDAASQILAFERLLPAIAGRRFLLFLSRIHEKKGCDLLIDAFALVAATSPDLDLVIAGPDQTGWRTSLEAQAQRLGVGARLHWPGMVAGDAKWGAFRACEAFVLPSHQENFGIVVAEAMACAKPVLISDKVNIWREIEAAGAGLVAADDSAGIAGLLARYLALPEERRAEMGMKARDCFLRSFEISKTSASLFDALEEACRSAPPRATSRSASARPMLPRF